MSAGPISGSSRKWTLSEKLGFEVTGAGTGKVWRGVRLTHPSKGPDTIFVDSDLAIRTGLEELVDMISEMMVFGLRSGSRDQTASLPLTATR